MNWIESIQNASIIVIPLAALLGWVYSRLDKKFEKMDERFGSLDKKIEDKTDSLRKDIQEVRKDIQGLDSRISRIEGQLIGPPPRWEPRVIEKREEK